MTPSRIFLMLLLLGFSFPFRLKMGLPVSLSLFEIALFIAYIFIIAKSLRVKSFYIGNVYIFFSAATLAVIPSISLAWSEDFNSSFQYTLFSLEAFFAYIAIINLLRLEEVNYVFTSFAYFAILLVIGAVLSFFHVPGFTPDVKALNLAPGMDVIYITTYYARLSHPFLGLSNNYAAVMALFVLPLLAAYFTYSKSFYGISSVIVIGVVFATLSRGILLPLIPIIATMTIYIIKTNFYKSIKILSIIPLSLFGVATYIYSNPLVLKYFGDRVDATTFDQRLSLVNIAIKGISKNELIGYGAGVQIDGLANLNSHNVYLDLLLYFGIFMGTLAIIALIIPFLIFSNNAKPKKNTYIISISLALSMITQYIIFLSQSTFDVTLKVALFICIGYYCSMIISSKPPSKIKSWHHE